MKDSPTVDTSCDLFIARHFRAPVEKVYHHFTNLESLKQWLCPEPCQVQGGTFDFRVGGKYDLQISTGEYGQIGLKGEYLEIVPNEKIAYAFMWYGHAEFSGNETRVTFTFKEENGGTTLHMLHTGLADAATRDDHHEGWNGSFDRLLLMTHMHRPGRITWNELYTRQPQDSKKFYAALMGWKTVEMPVDETRTYTMFSDGSQPVAGLVEITPECGDGNIPTHWGSYINVVSLDETLTKAEKLGATVVLPATKVGKMGTMAVITDPQGGTIALWEGNC